MQQRLHQLFSLHLQLDIIDNKIPEPERPVRPTVNERDIVEKNEIPVLGNDDRREDNLSNVLMSHTGNESITSKTEFLAGQSCSYKHL